MKKNDTIIVLGGSRPHSKLISYLNSKNFRTVLIDYLPNPPAKAVADIHYQESSLDVDAVERIAVAEKASHIMDICTDRAIPPAAYVAERLGFPHPYSYETSLIATNKNKMKSMLQDSNIPTSRFVKVTDVGQIADFTLRYPIIAKPSDASGSIGITKVDNRDALEKAVEDALHASRNGEAIVEEFVEGREVQMDCFVCGKKVHVLDIKEKRKFTSDKLTLSYGSLIPARISEQQRLRCVEICNSISSSLNIENGPLYVQAIANSDDVYVIEFGLRFGGNLSYKILEDVSGIDIVSATAEAYLGNIFDIQPNKSFKGFYTTYHVFPQKGIIGKVIGYEELIKEGVISLFNIKDVVGQSCTGEMSSKERIASFIIRSDSMEENNSKLRCVINTIDILDSNGKPIMRKDIYEI